MNRSIVVLSMLASTMLAGGVARAACGSGLACEQCNLAAFAPAVMAPPWVAVGAPACTDAQLDAYFAACLSETATDSTCGDFQVHNPQCTSCLYTKRSDAKWGLQVCDGASCSPNTAGCVDMLLAQVQDERANGGLGSCGDMMPEVPSCEHYACGQCSESDFASCDASAMKNECKPFASALDAATGVCAERASVIAKCQPSDEASWKAMGAVMCGTLPPPDAGNGASSRGGGCSSSGGEPGTFAWIVAIGAVVARLVKRRANA
jgi:hypothetical protein